jgi:hypothetical protein
MSNRTQPRSFDSLSLPGIIDRRCSIHKSSATQNRKPMHFSHYHYHSHLLMPRKDRESENALGPAPYRPPFRCILLTWSFMLSMRLNTRPHSSPSEPRHSHLIPGLCFASWRARSFLLEKPPPLEALPLRLLESVSAQASDCGQPSTRQKRCLECRLKCLRRSQPRVKRAREVQPGYAHRHVCEPDVPGCGTGTP